MPIRPARRHDLPTISDILAEAFHDEEFMGPIMHPYRLDYPQDYHRFWEHKVSEWYWDYSHQLIVSYTVEKDDGGHSEETLTGVGDWIRHGKGWERYWGIWGKWDPRTVTLPLLRLAHHLILSHWRPNRAADPAMHRAIATLFTHTTHIWSGHRAAGWYLNYLGVSAAHRNQGFGTALATWGIERARAENVAASVVCAGSKRGFYGRCGFGAVGGRVSEGEGNPLAGSAGEAGWVMFWDP